MLNRLRALLSGTPRLSIASPISGAVVDHSAKANPKSIDQNGLGPHISINALDNTLVAPADGIITYITQDQSACNFITQEGLELFIQLGTPIHHELRSGVTEWLTALSTPLTKGTPMVSLNRNLWLQEVESPNITLIIANADKVSRLTFAQGHMLAGQTPLVTFSL